MAALQNTDRNRKQFVAKDNRCLYLHIFVLYLITVILASVFSVASWFYYQQLSEVKLAVSRCWSGFNYSQFKSFVEEPSLAGSAFNDYLAGAFTNSGGSVKDRTKRSVLTEADEKKLFWLAVLKENSLALHSYCRRAKEYCSAEGQPGPPGVKGAKGDRGETGRPGAKGSPGNDVVLARVPRGIKRNANAIMGPPGPKGEQGMPGYPGEKGDKGDAGFPGPRGPPGLPGQDGLDGLDGMTGAKGEKGDKGDRGLLGFPGGKGPVGPIGPQGPPGPMGKVGKDGLDGHPGVPGVPGRNGTDGIPGRRGKKGDSGTPGKPGPRGESGTPGVPGFKGYKGERGEQGWPGVDCRCQTRRQSDQASMQLDRYVQTEEAEPEGEWAMCQVHCVDNYRRTRTTLNDVKADPIPLRSEPSNSIRPTASLLLLFVTLSRLAACLF